MRNLTLFDLLLWCYPRSFRNEYGAEMRDLFVRERQAARGLEIPALWLRTVADVVSSASAAHLDILQQDLSHTRRLFQRSRGFVLAAVVVVALGIGATTAAFSVTDFVLLRGLPFPEPERLVKIWETTPGYGRMELSAPNYRDWKAAARSYRSMGIFRSEELTLMASGEPQRLEGAGVSADLLPTLGVSPALGRGFSEADDRDGAPATVILSHGLWQRTFGGDPGIVGRGLVFGDTSYTVIGVMPETFHFPSSDVQFWVPNRFGERDYLDTERTNNWLEAVGRLRPGVTIDAASAEMQAIASRLREQYPRENKDTGSRVEPLGAELSRRSRLLLLALSGASACLLLIACANLANLLLARALARSRELAVRAALGAGRERLVRQLMTENLLLAFVGGGLGVTLAWLAVPLLAHLVPTSLPIAASPSMDGRVLAFAVLLTLATGLGFGLAPVLRGSGRHTFDGLREGVRAGGGARERLRGALVTIEIAACVVLLVITGLLLRTIAAVQDVNPGFQAEGTLTLRAELPTEGRYAAVAAREAFYDRVLDDVRRLPSVTDAGFISFMPISTFRGGIWPVILPGVTDVGANVRSEGQVACLRYVTPGYFGAMRIPLLRGRGIERRDTQDAPFVAVVSASFVQQHWPEGDPIGRRFTFAFAEREVVGVVGDVRFRGLERESEPQVYLSSAQVPDTAVTFYAPRALVVRTTLDPGSLMTPVRAIIRQADPRLAITEAQTGHDLLARDVASRAAQVRVLAVFASVAFVLAGVGIHAVLAFLVSQRSREIATRRVLGARAPQILGMIGRRSLRLTVAGVVPGVLLAYLSGRSMEALLFGVEPADLLTYACAIVLAAVMAAIGSLLPALRALSVDPMTALRSE